MKSHSWLDAAILDLPLFARRPRRIFPTSLTGDVTSEIAEDDWERGCRKHLCAVLSQTCGKKAIATVNKLKIGLFCQRSAANIE